MIAIAIKPMVLLFYTALFFSLLFVPLSKRIALRLGAVDLPDARKIHAQSTPRLGGIGIAAGLLPGLLLFFYPLDSALTGFVLGALIVFITGLLDDIYNFRPLWKFLGQVLAVSVFVVVGDQSLNGVGNLLGTGNVDFGGLAGPLTVFCMVGLINAFNLSDGLDGLAGGLALIAGFSLGALAYQTGAWQALAVMVACEGAVLGFLRYNTYPAKLFMGDCGSLLIGYALAAVAVMLANSRPDMPALPITVATILALPIVDTVLVMARRVWRGQSPFLPDKTHLHHRLMYLGLPHAAVVPILYCVMAAFGLVAVAQRNLPENWQFFIGICLALSVFGLVSLLQRSGVNFCPGVKENDLSFAQTKVFTYLSGIAGKSVQMASYVIALGLCLPLLFMNEISDEFWPVALATGLIALALFPWRSPASHLTIVYTLVYILSFCVLFILNIHQQSYPWIKYYLFGFSLLVMVWSWLKIYFRKHGEVFLTSGIELLFIFTSWFIPLVLIPLIGVSWHIELAIWLSCIEVIPLVLACKIIIRSQYQQIYFIPLCMLAILSLVAVRGAV